MPLALRAFLGLLLALVPAAFVLIQMERDARIARDAGFADQATRLVQRVAAQQAATIGAARQLISAIAATPQLRTTDCTAFLRRVLEANPRYLAADLTNGDGRPICTTRTNPPADLGLLAVLRGDGFRLGGYQPGAPPFGASLSLAEPVRDASGRTVGAVALTLSLDWLGRDLEALGLPPDSAATIADRNGIVLASSRDPQTRVGRAISAFAHRFLDAAAAGVAAATGEEGLRHLAYVPSGASTNGLFFAVGIDERPASLLADRRVALMIVGALLLSFLLALLTFHTSAEGPVQALLGAARRWGRQDWSARVGRIGGGRDFRRLAAAFDGMAEAVEARQKAEARWQACMEAAPLFVLAADREGQVEWANAQWREATGLSLNESRGDGWLAAIDPQDRPAVEAAWRVAVADPRGTPLLQELWLQGGHRCLLKGAPAVSAEGEVLAWALFGLDVRELRQAEALADTIDARLRAVYAHAPVGLCLLDRELRVLAINERLARAHGGSVADHMGRRLSEVAPHFAAELETRLRHLVETGEPVEDLEFCADTDGEERCWLCSYHPVRDRAGMVAAISGAVVDITARRRMEDSARRLSREVDHRAQNALSVVRGLLRLTAADAPDDVPALVEELEGRIGAMSRAHDVLSRENWTGADLGEIVVRELAAHSGRVEASGPPLRLTPEAAQPLALALHELVSNAQRHGALSGREGCVALVWERMAEGAELRWVERGGPPVMGPPERIGFGTMLIDANIRTQLAGDIRRLWEPEGLTCILTIGADALTREAKGPDLAKGRLTGRRVLLVDDDPISALSLATALREDGCHVLGPAGSVAEAMLLAGQAGRVDAAVLGGSSMRQLSEALHGRASVILHLSPEGLKGRPVTPAGLRQALVEAFDDPRDS